ncbi:MAG: helix-turn-helix transcriptional regulator [Oscillibacter sp.]|nr:helix-turn-helix transcriptional regulator [Oscillibacter sp.]
MAQKTIQGNEILARQIKLRRNELGLTIEEAASRAGVGTKTWSRYEAGESIRRDKCKGICKALNWHSLPDQDGENSEQISVQEYKNHEAWSQFLYSRFGVGAAVSFAVGSDILLDHIEGDMAELASMPIGTHIGQLGVSWLNGSLPEQFLTRYNYEFMHQMKCTLLEMRTRAQEGLPMTAHSVVEELLIYLCCKESSSLFELSGGICGLKDCDHADYKDWIFELFGDMDIIHYLYSNVHLNTEHPYNFSHWSDQQFYIDSSYGQ